MSIAIPRPHHRAALLLATCLLLTLLVACAGAGGSANNPNPNPQPATGGEVVYVGGSTGTVSAFSVDMNSGALTPVAGSPFSVGGATVRLAADPAGKALFATNATVVPSNVQALNIDPASGALTAAASFSANLPPGAIAVDPSGRNAYVVPDPSLAQGFITAFNIDPNTRALTALPGQPTGLAGIGHSLVVDPSGRFVYITMAGTPGVEIAGRARDPNTGALTNLPTSPFGNIGGDNPQGIAMTPSGAFAVIANQATNNISVMAMAVAPLGELDNIGGSPFAAGTAPVAVAIDPTGKFVFVANQASNNLSVFSMNTTNGGLAPMAGSPFPTGAGPLSVAVDPAGKFVYVSNSDGTVSAYSLNPGTGALTPITGSPFMVAAGTALPSIVVVRH